MRSMRQYLTLLLISSLILIIFTAAMHGYQASTKAAASLMDRELKSVLVSVASSHDVNMPEQQSSAIAYQIWQRDTLLAKSLNAPESPIAKRIEGFSDSNFESKRWRTYTQSFASSDVWIMVAQPVTVRFTLAESMTISSVIPAIISVPILALIVFWAVSKGLNPLKQLSANLSKRTGKDLTPVSLHQLPSELSPVVGTLNSMFVRLHSAFEREQQFASNAAHELRTPLSVMKINLHNLAQEMDERKDRIKALEEDTNRMIHVVNQILLLSRTSPEMFHFQLSKVEVFEIAQQVIADIYGKLEAKHQQIELLGQHCNLQSTEFSLYTLLQNLVVNASNYSPAQAQIRVTVTASGSTVKLSIDDSGPGIPDAEKSKVLNRFYREKHEKIDNSRGSGLGLAIVGQIVALHHGSVSLADSALGGLNVTVQLPVKVAGNGFS